MNDQGFFYQPKPEWNPHQLEIEFFWPLTEQIPLELDYEGCATKNTLSVGIPVGNLLTTVTGTTTWSTTVVAPVLEVNSDGLTFKNTKHMPWYRKVMFKLLGFKWD